MANDILTTRDLTTKFGSFCAVDNVSLSLKKGSITGLIGPNGAGKSTLFNTLTGTLKPSSGQVFLSNEDISGLSPDRLFKKGLVRTFQIPRPFARMSVLENVMLSPAQQTGEKIFGSIFRPDIVRREEQAYRAKALEILDFVTLDKLADQAAGELSGGQTKLLELARVLMGDASIILLDEPAAGVNPVLTQILIERIEELNRRGMTFLIIEHNMDFIMSHCDPIIAMAQGQLVFQGTAEEAQTNKTLLDAYLGAPVNV